MAPGSAAVPSEVMKGLGEGRRGEAVDCIGTSHRLQCGLTSSSQPCSVRLGHFSLIKNKFQVWD